MACGEKKRTRRGEEGRGVNRGGEDKIKGDRTGGERRGPEIKPQHVG